MLANFCGEALAAGKLHGIDLHVPEILLIDCEGETMSASTWGLHWFRRDLRIFGNTALHENWKRNNGKVVGIFCIDSDFLSRPDFSVPRFAFFLKTLAALQDALRASGSDLLVVNKPPKAFFKDWLQDLTKNGISPPRMISWNRDYEPFARRRDTEIEKLLQENGCGIFTQKDHLIVEPQEILRDPKEPASYYSVYTPFLKKWLAALASAKVQNEIASSLTALPIFKFTPCATRASERIFDLTWEQLYTQQSCPKDQLESTLAQTLAQCTIEIPSAGTAAALETLAGFQCHLHNYDKNRNYPALRATSQLSIYFKNGSLTTSQVVAALGLAKNLSHLTPGAKQFLMEIAWREFYFHLLYHCPAVELQAFKANCRNIRWENNSDFFEAWKNGLTGFPIVDAGMRELSRTGRMHNRVRMIVASFLTKDLLVDWRWGERHFMQMLLDGDLAANNGGWQWAASTGCDAQPFFRIFNPKLQSEKFDPDGSYIAANVPELAHLKGTAQIHDPFSGNHAKDVCEYPRPIVDHARQRTKAIRLFSEKK